MDEYLIGDLLLQVPECGVEFYYAPHMERFRHDGTGEHESILFSGAIQPLAQYLTKPLGKDNGVYQPFLAGNEQVLVYHWGRLLYGFAVKPETFTVLFDSKMTQQVPLNTDWFFGVSGLHRQLLLRGASILHASYIERNGKAILFTAPSQTGKSTQAMLWEQHAEAQIINGDRALLRQREGTWHAYGFPCCGSSRICVNRTLPLAAIVVLEQGSENRVVSMSAMEKVKALVTGMEFYHWDQMEMNLILQQATRLAEQVQIVRLVCRPDEDAVHCLKSYLESEGSI